MNWDKQAANTLKSIIKKNGLTYEQLANKLKEININESPASIAMKINRGTFKFGFFLQCAEAIGLEKVQLK